MPREFLSRFPSNRPRPPAESRTRSGPPPTGAETIDDVSRKHTTDVPSRTQPDAQLTLSGVPRFLNTFLRVLLLITTLYVFLVSVKLLGTGFKMFGSGFAENLIATTSNPF
ncbi:hypothetical protein K8S17_05295, partial [bacterium]|nr:hypothetical protein [bacterium]